jgi:4-amino-4-deoxy-L-arabinose transferase-like glycosyltransferase
MLATLEQDVLQPRTRLRFALQPWMLVMVVGVLNLFYIASPNAVELSPDEAHYWDWSRHLDLCYYSKGPLVAWLIRASTTLFGITPFGVRFPAVVCGVLILLGLLKLCRRHEQWWLLGIVVALPTFSAASVLMTIDPPLLACWTWGLVAVQQRRWKILGVLLAIGLLAKLTMLLFVVGLVGWLIFAKPINTRGVWQSFAIGSLGFVPIILWNLQHDGVSALHLMGHANNGEAAASWFSAPVFVLGQFALLLGFGFVLCVVGWWNSSRTDPLLWLSAPVLGFFIVASVRSNGQANWAAPAYLGGLILGVRWWLPRSTLLTRRLLIVGFVLGMGASVLVRFPTLLRPVLAALLPVPTEQKPLPIRQLDPTARLAGWKTLAEAVDRIRFEEERLGQPVFLATMVWTTPGELGFYCAGHPPVYSFGPALADRNSQYDLWHPNPVAEAQEFAGQSFVYVGEELPSGVCDELLRKEHVTHTENGVPLASWTIWVGRGYRGFAGVPREHPRRY